MITKVVAPLCLFAALAPLLAQIPPEVSYCPAGVRADGFIDWTKLPKPPKSGAVTATLPVAGIANLTATFYIPGPANPAHEQNPSYYTVENSAALALPLGVNPTITFSKPVQGVSVSFQTFGRFGHDFKMTASNIAGGTTSLQPPDAQVDSNGGDYPGQQLSSAPLQIRSTSADLVSVAFQFTGDPVEDIDFELINLRIESGSAVDPAAQVPRNGLREWLRGDRVNAFGPTNVGNVVSWPDQSGNGSDALPPSSGLGPMMIVDGPNCSPVVSFQQSQLNFKLPINGWTAMTVILAAQSYADDPGWWENQALFWNETEYWGSTFFTPSQTNVFFRFGTTQTNNQPLYARPSDAGGDFSVTTAVHSSNADTLYVNGLEVLQQSGKLPAIAGTVPTASIGGGLGNTFFTGNIGEILIYDRVLTTAERELIEHYLMSKYGVP